MKLAFDKIKEIADRYGIGVKEVPEGEGGFIYDDTREVHKHLPSGIFDDIINNSRNATPEELDSVEKYIESISSPTGLNFFDNIDVNKFPQGQNSDDVGIVEINIGKEGIVYDSIMKNLEEVLIDQQKEVVNLSFVETDAKDGTLELKIMVKDIK